jgi:3-oxoacyl-[acyl-carrier protein] reductase
MGKLQGKVAAVTGGGSGIGRAIAMLFAREGARVGILDRNGNAAEAVAAEIAGEGHSGLAVTADVGDEVAITAALDKLVAAFGDIDIMVNNAGIDRSGPLTGIALAEWEEMFRIHVTGTFLCCRYVLPAMQKKGWGRIINMSSQLAHKGTANRSHYCAAKAAVMGLTRALAYEAAPFGVTVNCLNPGPIDTPMVATIPRDWRAAKIAELPIKRAGQPEEVAPAALLLASDEGAYFVGASMNMNGGDYMI